MESRYEEIDRIDEEIRKAKEREQKWQLKKRRKLKEIQEAERIEREAWYSVITDALDAKLRERYGALYWERLDPESTAKDLCVACSATIINSGGETISAEAEPVQECIKEDE